MSVPHVPVIAGLHPDPSICRVGDDYFLVNSSFEYTPGVPLFTSRNLRDWTLLGHVLDRPEQLQVASAYPSGGVYAPTLRHHAGRFWMITTNVSDSPGQILVTAEDPRGPWSDPVRVPGVDGIDPDLAWDADGTCWLTWSGEPVPGDHSIVQAKFDPTTGSLLSEPKALWRGTGGQWPEGPHLYRRGSWWYLLIAEGGTERGHAVTVARGPAPDGPFEPDPGNPILTARGTDWPVQSTGHADLVQRADGRWAMVFLGVRLRGMSPCWHVLGRETFAAEVEWVDGWPRLGAPIEPVRAAAPTVEELSGQELPPAWVTPSRWIGDVLQHRDGGWHLDGRRGAECFAGRRQEHLYLRTRARLRVAGGGAGLEVRIDPYHKVAVWQEEQLARAVVTVGGIRTEFGRATIGDDVTLELRAQPSIAEPEVTRLGPDVIVAGIRDERGFVELGRLDGRYLSTEVAGGFTGRMVGVASEGDVTIEAFRYEGSDDPGHIAWDAS